MKTNFQMLRELLEKYHPKKRMFFSEGEPELIKETLCINEMDILALRNLRDFVVLFLGNSEDREDMDRMSAITWCIDDKICELGGEV